MKRAVKKLIILVCCVFCMTGCSYFQYTYLLRAKRQTDRFNFVRAVELLNKCDSAFLHESGALADRAFLLEFLGLDDAAMRDLDVLFASGEAGYNEYSGKAKILKHLGRYEEAMAVYDEMRSLGLLSDDMFYYWKGYCLESLGNDEEALECYIKAIPESCTEPYYFLRRGRMYLKLGMPEEAERDFHKVLELDTDAHMLSHREYALFYLGRKDEAYAWIDELKEFDAADPTFDYDEACLLTLDKRYDEAFDALKTALEKGFYSFDLLRDNFELDSLRSDPRFNEMVLKYQQLREEELKELVP